MNAIFETPPISPEDLEAWFMLGEEDKRGYEPYPVGHLVGRIAIEDRIEAAQNAWENGLQITAADRDLLQLAMEFALDDEDLI